ncbi:Antidote-toxin recognition MazE, bacterial antitoxin [uncultured archaeon]|nr:Antidote-toxin recognition MazE, bacterial antitoxin [uncultured archaeon]
MQSVIMSTKGQVIIPASTRKKYGLKKGERLVLIEEKDHIKIMPKTRLTDLCGSVKLDMKVVRKQIEDMRKEDRY